MTEEFVEDIITAASSETPPEGEVTPEDTGQPEDEGQDLATSTKDDGETDEGDADTDESASDPAAQTLEEIATELGWKPDHEGENFVDAKTYILRSREIQDSMRDHNKDLKSQLQTLQGSVDALKEHNERVYKAEVSRMQSEIDRLKKSRKEAIEMADVSKVEEIDSELDNIEKSLSEPRSKPGPVVNPVYDEWVKDNEWYLTNEEMATYADTIAHQYAGAPLPRLYALVRNKVAEVFPEHFEPAGKSDAAQPGTLANPSGKAPAGKPKAVGPASPVESGRNQSTAKTFTKADLTSDQLSIMNQFVKSGIMTEKQYISDLAKLQEA